jgi:2-oxoisovalerate dehydrogenase E1 component
MAASIPSTGSAKQVNRAEVVDQNFIAYVKNLKERLPDLTAASDTAMTAQDLLELFDSQIQSRQMDLMARVKRLENKVFYTIGSSGHEGNALVGRLTRHTDPAFLHYRSGAFMAERSRQLADSNFIHDTALSFAASKNDPASGGRHKVWGSRPMWVIPQTSTIASHLPKALGTALAIAQAPRLQRPLPVPEDSIVMCSFGDASFNHSTAQGALNATQWAAYQCLQVPLLFVCEDNNIGISVRTPEGWIESNFKSRPGIHYVQADGLDLSSGFDVVRDAVNRVRQKRQPVFLHLKTTRLMGHAGTDFEVDYRAMADLEAAEARDPLLRSAELIVAAGLMNPDEIIERYEECREECLRAADEADQEERLTTLEAVSKPLAPYHPRLVEAEAARRPRTEDRVKAFGSERQLPENMGRKHLAILLNWGLTDLMAKYPETLLFGEDVAQKGGVYTVTRSLLKRFGNARVFNTLLDEQTILGLAQGYGTMGLLPIPEIQYLAYFHNACDQIRGEACSLQFFSNAQFRNPMLMRIASLGYQKGFGGHFHNDNSIAALRDIPGLVVGCPSRGDDAVTMMRTLASLAREDGRVCAFLEPIALYMTKDLYSTGDGGWLFAYPEPGKAMPLGEGRVYFPEAKQLLIITFGNGVPMSLRAARDIEAQTGAKVRVLDLRWLQPLNTEQIVAHAAQCDAILVVDEGRRSAGVGEGIITAITEGQLGHKPLQRVVGADCFTPLGDAAGLVLPSEQDIVDAGLALCQTPAEDDDDAAEAVLVDAADSEALVSDTSESDALINDTVADTSTVEATEADSAEAATDHVESVEPEAESAVIIEESMTTVAANDPAVVVLSETDTAPTIDHAETQTETATEIDSDDSSTDD